MLKNILKAKRLEKKRGQGGVIDFCKNRGSQDLIRRGRERNTGFLEKDEEINDATSRSDLEGHG